MGYCLTDPTGKMAMAETTVATSEGMYLEAVYATAAIGLGGIIAYQLQQAVLSHT